MRHLLSLGVCSIAILLLLGGSSQAADPLISGELRQWHKVTLTVDGPDASEKGMPNPFLDYRMQVKFQHSETGLTYLVPGYFAADGNAANTSSTSGNKWRAHLSPDHKGDWTYEISFRKGPSVAISDDSEAGDRLASVDGLKGTFTITESNKTGRDFRSKGRLNYVGKHHLQFAGTGEFFLKAGVDAPENLLSYRDFDGDFKSDGHKDNLVKDWAPHVKDWQPGDPSWQDGKGKGLIGVVNYLASQGLNSFSFLTLNIEGDDRNVFPYTTYNERNRLDCSRLDQWEIVFEHGTSLGMYLHFKTLEAENVNLLDDGHLGPQRKLYYRELIARFGHHLALNWNLGEEVGLGHKVSTEKKLAWANYFATHDPYHHHIVIHNGNNHYDLLGESSALTGFSLQTNQSNFGRVHSKTLDYINRSVKAGKPWVVACDEPGDASHSLITDKEDSTHDNARKNALWGNIMAGGAGVEWYFGYAHPHSDLSCQDFRVRQNMWKQCRIALKFFADHKIPFWDMTNANSLIANKDDYCLSEPGNVYLVFLKQSIPTTLDLSDANGIFEVLWFNPRKGGPLLPGTIRAVNGSGKVSLGNPPDADGQDWLAIVRPGDPNRDYPPGVTAGQDKTVMLPRSGNSISVDLNGFATDDRKSDSTLTSSWKKISGPGKVEFADKSKLKTQVTLHDIGTYRLGLTADDGKLKAGDSLTIVVEPFQTKVTKNIRAIDSVYLEGSKVISDKYLKVEGKRRISIIKFKLEGLPPNILTAQLRLTGSPADSGNGTLRVFRGSHSDWKGATFKHENAPKPGELLGKDSVDVSPNNSITVPVNNLISGDGTYTLIVTLDQGGNDIWFSSTETGSAPELIITFDDPDGKYSESGQKAITPIGKTQPVSSSVLAAVTDFKFADGGDFVPGYLDGNRKAMAINAAQHQGKFSAAESKYQGTSGTYDLLLTTLTETDGESSYRLIVNDKKIGEVTNPGTKNDYEPAEFRFNDVALKPGDIIRIEFNSASNGKIPEGNAFAFSRGRWRSVSILQSGATDGRQKKYEK